VDLVAEYQTTVTTYPFGREASEATEFFTKSMVTNENRSDDKLSGAVHLFLLSGQPLLIFYLIESIPAHIQSRSSISS